MRGQDCNGYSVSPLPGICVGMVPTASSPPDILSLSSDAFRVARDLCGVAAAHRAAYDPVRAARLEVARMVLADALGWAIVSRRRPPLPHDGGRR